MRRRANTTIHELREAIDCLPRDTRIAMLRGIESNRIIAGAYADGDGICPMLAAHRAGGRTSFISFARAWDDFAFRGHRVRRARRATRRELLILRTHLEASLVADELRLGANAGAAARPAVAPGTDLSAAIAEHLALLERRDRVRDRGVRPGDPDRSRELRHRSGWRWMPVVRSLDDYERALHALGELEAQLEPEQRRPAPAGARPTDTLARA